MVVRHLKSPGTQTRCSHGRQGSVPTSIERSEDRLTKRYSIPAETIITFCDDFYRENAGFMHPPFIDYDGEEDLKVKPDHYDEMIAELAKNFEPEPADEAASGVDPNEGVSIASPKVKI